MLGYIIVAGVRSAIRNGNRPAGQKPQQWQPFTQLVVWFFAFAVPITIGGPARFVAIAILAVIVVSVVLTVIIVGVNAATKRKDETAKPADPLAEFFSDKKEGTR